MDRILIGNELDSEKLCFSFEKLDTLAGHVQETCIRNKTALMALLWSSNPQQWQIQRNSPTYGFVVINLRLLTFVYVLKFSWVSFHSLLETALSVADVLFKYWHKTLGFSTIKTSQQIQNFPDPLHKTVFRFMWEEVYFGSSLTLINRINA